MALGVASACFRCCNIINHRSFWEKGYGRSQPLNITSSKILVFGKQNVVQCLNFLGCVEFRLRKCRKAFSTLIQLSIVLSKLCCFGNIIKLT